MTKKIGSLRVLTIQNIAVNVHWTFPLGGLLPSIFAGFRFPEFFYYCIAYALLITIHEIGHLLAARTLGLKVFSIDISGAGGECRLQLPTGVFQTLLVYSAGLVAQVILLVLTILFAIKFDKPVTPFWLCLANTFTTYNILLIAMNAIPGKSLNGYPNDGKVLWNTLLHAIGRTPRSEEAIQSSPIIFPPETSLLALDGFVPFGFKAGVEILNDNTTPMDFVVSTLEKNLQLDKASAVQLMLDIHFKGGALISLESNEIADSIAIAVTEDARRNGHSLVCRAVER